MLASKLNTQPSIDFFSELSKIVNNKHESPNTNAQTILSESSEPSNLIISTPTANDSTEINYCLISKEKLHPCLLYTSPSPRDRTRSRMPSSA